MTTSPNRATAAARKPTLLFVDYAVPQYDLYAGSRTNFMYLELLASLGLDVKFLPADFKREEPYSTELNRMGIETLDAVTAGRDQAQRTASPIIPALLSGHDRNRPEPGLNLLTIRSKPPR